MKKAFVSIVAILLMLPAMAGTLMAAEDGGPSLQLAVLLDGSNSVLFTDLGVADDTEWRIQIDGLRDAILDENCIPRDGSVELTVVQFGATRSTGKVWNEEHGEWVPVSYPGARTYPELTRVVVTESNAASLASFVDTTLRADPIGGSSTLHYGLDAAAWAITGDNAIEGAKRIVNISTDGGSDEWLQMKRWPAEEARDAAIGAGIDEISAEGLGDIDESCLTWLKDQIVYPEPGNLAPPFDPGWVYLVGTDSAKVKRAICEKVGAAPEPTPAPPTPTPPEPTPTVSPEPTPEPTPTPLCTLTVHSQGCCEVAIEGGGIVYPGGYGEFQFSCGTVVELEALDFPCDSQVGEICCTFVEWMGNVSSSDGAHAYVMVDGDTEVWAVCSSPGEPTPVPATPTPTVPPTVTPTTTPTETAAPAPPPPAPPPPAPPAPTVPAATPGPTATPGGTYASAVVYLVSIQVMQPSDTISVGQSQEYRAIGTYSDGTTADITAYVLWTYNGSIVDIHAGLGTGLGAGTTDITASLGGATSDAVTLNVVSPAAELLSIEVTPEEATIGVSQNQQFTATATYSDGGKKDVTGLVVWLSNLSIATIDSNGLATGVNTGTTLVRAMLKGITSPAVELTVASSVPWSLIGGIIGGVLGAGFVFFLVFGWLPRRRRGTTEGPPA